MALEKRQWTLIDDMNVADTTKGTYKSYFKKLFQFCSKDSEKDYFWYDLVSQVVQIDNKKLQEESFNKACSKFLELPDDELQHMLERFLDAEKERVKQNLISPNTIPKYFVAYRILLDANYREHAVKWKPIMYKYPKKEKKSGFKPWLTTQIEAMLKKCDNLKKESVIMFQASTGGRVGVHNDPLLMKHMIKMDGKDLIGLKDAPDYPYDYHCYAILVYAEADETVEEKDQRILNEEVDSEDYSFFVFLIPEAAYILDLYHQQRKDSGEGFVSDTPIYLGSDTHSSLKGTDKNFYQFSGNAFRHLMESLVKRANIQRIKKRNRYDTMIDHGYRKRFNTILKIDNEINSNIAEKLMQHLKGLDGTYLTPTRQQCFAEFVKAIPELTINPKEKQRMEIAKKDKIISNQETQFNTKLEMFGEKIHDLQEEMSEMKKDKEDTSSKDAKAT